MLAPCGVGNTQPEQRQAPSYVRAMVSGGRPFDRRSSSWIMESSRPGQVKGPQENSSRPVMPLKVAALNPTSELRVCLTDWALQAPNEPDAEEAIEIDCLAGSDGP